MGLARLALPSGLILVVRVVEDGPVENEVIPRDRKLGGFEDRSRNDRRSVTCSYIENNTLSTAIIHNILDVGMSSLWLVWIEDVITKILSYDRNKLDNWIHFKFINREA